jgi:hypothetical protein
MCASLKCRCESFDESSDISSYLSFYRGGFAEGIEQAVEACHRLNMCERGWSLKEIQRTKTGKRERGNDMAKVRHKN